MISAITGSIIWKVLKGIVWKDDGPNILGKCLAVIVAGFVAWQVNNAHQRHVGAERLATKIEQKAKANEKMVDAVRRKSGSGASGGVLDPYNANSKR